MPSSGVHAWPAIVVETPHIRTAELRQIASCHLHIRLFRIDNCAIAFGMSRPDFCDR